MVNIITDVLALPNLQLPILCLLLKKILNSPFAYFFLNLFLGLGVQIQRKNLVSQIKLFFDSVFLDVF